MSDRFPGALRLSWRVLRTLRILNFAAGGAIAALLMASLLAPDALFAALGVRPASDAGRLERGMRLIMLAGIIAVPVSHVILARLLAIVATVREGDPFVRENGHRLQAIAWAVLGLEALHLVIGVIAAGSASSVQPLDIDWHFSVTPWVAVLLLFVLARVFDHGARMRADLEGTV